MSSKTKDKKIVITGIVLIIVSIFITSLALELTLRIAGYNPLKKTLEGNVNLLRTSPVRERGYEALPNNEFYLRDTHISINSHGFRDREYDVSKNKDTYRIVVLGDSITFGIAIPFESLYSEQLESLFHKNKRNVEVINTGLLGYDTLAEVSTLEQAGIQFDPDLVIVGYCINDLNISSDLAKVMEIEKYRSWIYKSRLVQFISAKTTILQERFNMSKMNKESEFIKQNNDYISPIGDEPALDKIIRQTKATGNDRWWNNAYSSKAHIGKLRYSFEKLKRMQDKNGFNVLIMFFSSFHDHEGSKDMNRLIYNTVEHESSRMGFDIINSYSTFESVGFKKLRNTDDDKIHPNALGHKLASEILYNFITARYNMENTR